MSCGVEVKDPQLRDEESREETVARWAEERPDLLELSKRDLPFDLGDMDPMDAYKVGALTGMRRKVKEGR